MPKQMHSGGDATERKARSEAPGSTWDSESGTVYVDAARGQDGTSAVVLVSSDGEKIISVTSVKRMESAARAEEVAIARAIACSPRATVLPDLQAACPHFAAGSIEPIAKRLI
ncbi:hypothetical protein HPB47_002732 [Ixodes persulcatus]|uniref:Uncharacterized protein n=1 Tax=Ixodes persulcatus TaxID=34615 RepID=A0AC60PKF0_IXOPE|nr:hypothetical protein HPB47_002732 [Ixodes persulcatus]